MSFGTVLLNIKLFICYIPNLTIMNYINKAIYFIAKIWFAIIMVLALILTSILSIPFFIIEWIDGSSSEGSTLLLRNRRVTIDRPGS